MISARRVSAKTLELLRLLPSLDWRHLSPLNFDGGRRALAKGKGAKKKPSKPPPSKKKKTQKTKKPQPLPKYVDPKIESKMDLCQQLLEPTDETPPAMTEEEAAAATAKAKEFSRRKMRQHREWQADMSAKEWLTRAAIQSLPPHLREEAVKEDTTPIPMRLPFPTDTPPREWT